MSGSERGAEESMRESLERLDVRHGSFGYDPIRVHLSDPVSIKLNECDDEEKRSTLTNFMAP